MVRGLDGGSGIRMEQQFQRYLTDPVESSGIAIEEPGDLLEAEHPGQEHLETAQDSSSTDDPVRVYLREMGSVRLLKRQGEIDLAKRMERGELRMHRALSRAPLVWSSVLAMF